MKENPKDGRNRNDGNHDSSERVLPPRGDYQTLLSFQKAEVVYDITFRFAHKYLSRGDRTVDQMIQSARSGKQNILEGSKAAQTSKEMEIIATCALFCRESALPVTARMRRLCRADSVWICRTVSRRQLKVERRPLSRAIRK